MLSIKNRFCGWRFLDLYKKLFKLSACFFLLLGLQLGAISSIALAAPCDNPILFVTQVPVPEDFTTIGSTFGNQRASVDSVFRGGDLYIRYPNGTLKNLTQTAGYGNSGFQGSTSIAVRDPAVHWSGNKALFSMVIGSPTHQYDYDTYYWQLYEVTGLGQSDTPVITKVPNQPATYNNVMGTYGSDDRIIFISDRPRNGATHLYPQLDEYESAATNTGLWSLSSDSGELFLLDHAPSGAFNPNVDSYGRITYTRWDHLQRDQQNLPSNPDYLAFTWASEDENATTTSAYSEVFPEPRDNDEPDVDSHINLHSFNHFFPWVINEDGTDHETLNHIGRQELHGYIERSFNNDASLQEYYGQYNTPNDGTKINNFFQIRESLKTAGLYFGIDAPEFSTHSAGQIVTLNAPLGLSADDMEVTYITHRDTSSYTSSPTSNHSGLYRSPIQCVSGEIVSSHTDETEADDNIGSSSNPQSRYAFRLKSVTQSGQYYRAGSALTSGISKSVSWWSPDISVAYSGQLWELQPVEVVARTRPAALNSELPAPEESILTDLGIDSDELRNYLIDNGLALLVGRDVTTRDDLDKQQPFNLRVSGTQTKTVGNGGTLYDVAHMQIVIGEQIRGYQGDAGRRVLAKFLSTISSYNPPNSSGPVGSVPVAEDGSWAAFVPARRALSWQLTSANGTPVVRERYWVTFGKGEIRSCASCHGANKLDQAGNTTPQNQPKALKTLLEYWKDLPPSGSSYKIGINAGKKTKSSKKPSKGKTSFKVTGLKPATYGTSVTLKFRVNGSDCSGNGINIALNSEGSGQSTSKLLPIGKAIKNISVLLYSDGVQRESKNFKPTKNGKNASASKLCQILNGM